MQVLVCSVKCAVPIKGSCLWKSNELSDSAGEFHIIFDTSSARQNRRKHPSNAKGHSASLERGYTIDSAPAFGSLAQCNCCRWLALDSVSTGITVL
jgi:hypothetical protein